MEIPQDPKKPVVNLVLHAMIALPDLEAIAETGHLPDDLTFLRGLAIAARRVMTNIDEA